MKRPALLAVCAAALLPAVFSCSSGQELHEIDARILGLIDRYGLPSMGAVVVTHGERSYLNALGLRSKGSNTAVTAGDAFHIGSNTKSMTAVLAAVTVQNGWISWDDTIGGIIGEEVEVGNSAYSDVTLAQLLTHTGGVPNQVDDGAWGGYFTDGLQPTEQRARMAEDVLAWCLPPIRGARTCTPTSGTWSPA